MEGWLIQVLTLVVGLLAVWLAQALGKKIMGPTRARGRKMAIARHHFVKGAQLLAQSRASAASGKSSQARSLAKQATSEAETALSLDPNDAACHVLKSLALEQQGLLPQALKAMDLALSPDIAKTLSSSEKADALFKRGGLLMSSSKGRRNLDAAIADFQQSLQIAPDNPKVLCLLAVCQERNKLFADAEKSYQRVLSLDPQSEDAIAGLARLRP